MQTIRAPQLRNELIDNIRARQAIMVWGPGGVGKSSIIAQVAAELKYKLIDLRMNLLEPVDLRGVPHVENNITKWAFPDFFPRVERDGEKGVLLLDELPNAMRATQSASYQLVLDRKLGEYELPDGWTIIAAGNRMTDRGGTFEMPGPLKSRFGHYELETNVDDWVAWAAQAQINDMITSFIRYRPELLHKVDHDHNANPTPRTWHMLSNRYAVGTPANEFLAVQALVGEGAAGEFLTYKRTYGTMPDIDAIIKEPKKGPVPDDDPAVMYAVCGALASRSTEKNFDAITEYTMRLPPEFQVILMRDAVGRNKSLGATKAFSTWATKNANIIL